MASSAASASSARRSRWVRRRRRQTIKLAVLQELSGAGATAGTNFKNGVKLAVKEINAAGGILGTKIEVTRRRHAVATPAWPRAWRRRRSTTTCSR